MAEDKGKKRDCVGFLYETMRKNLIILFYNQIRLYMDLHVNILSNYGSDLFLKFIFSNHSSYLLTMSHS